MLPWPFQGEQQLASPDSRIMGLSSEFIQCTEANSPDVSFILVGIAMSEAKGSPRCAPECTAPTTRLSEPLSNIALNSRQFSNFILRNLSYWQAPWVSHEVVLWCRGEKRNSRSHFSSSKVPAAFDSVPMLISSRSPILGTAVAITHSWQGALSWKV